MIEGEKKKGGHKTTASARNARRSGDEYEREVKKFLSEEIGLPCKKVPLSGGAPGWPDDLITRLPFVGAKRLECKIRKKAGDRTKVIRDWLGEADLLFVRVKAQPGHAREPSYVYMRAETFAEIVRALVTLEQTTAGAAATAESVATELEQALADLGGK